MRVPALLLAAGLGLLACGGSEAPGAGANKAGAGEPPRPVVAVVRVTPETVSNQAELLGQLEAAESVVVRSEVAGILESIEFQEGQQVQKGQVLFRLRDDEPRARLHEARAELTLARDSYRRAKDLAARQVVSPAQLEKLAASLDAARARVELARVALDRTRIRAPFDGVTGPRLVSPGGRIEPDTDLVQVEAVSSLELVFSLPEQVMALARVGVPIELTVAPYPHRRFPGEIFFVAPSLNPQNRRLLVKARVPNPDLALRPGLFAKVQADIGQRVGALLVPDDAVVYGSEGSFVWRLDEHDVAHPVNVELGPRREGRVEVRSGLEAGDVVVVAGTQKLAPGTRVEVQKDGPDGASGTGPTVGGVGTRAPKGAG